MIVILILYILILSLLSITSPTKYVIGYIIFVSLFFGIVPSDSYVYNGVDYCTLLLNLSCVIPLATNFPKAPNAAKYLIICWTLFYIYGIIRPVLLGYQDIILSIKASKSYLTFAFASYLIVMNRSLDYKKIFGFILILSLYFSFLYVISRYFPLNSILLGYEKEDGIQCWYDSFLYFSLFYVCSEWFPASKKTRLTYILLLMVGIFIGGYFSLFGCSVVFLIYVSYLRLTKKYSISARRILGIFVALSIVCVAVNMIRLGYFDDIISSQSAAMDSRNRNNIVREYLIAREIVFGYGFISQNSSFIQGMMQDGNQYAQSLSFIDAGYIDLLGKFGIIGAILFLLIPVGLIRYMRLKEDNVFVVLIISFYAINITWAVMCYPMGVIVLGLIFSYWFRTHDLKYIYYEETKKLARSKSARP